MWAYIAPPTPELIIHWGVPGMKWGIRKPDSVETRSREHYVLSGDYEYRNRIAKRVSNKVARRAEKGKKISDRLARKKERTRANALRIKSMLSKNYKDLSEKDLQAGKDYIEKMRSRAIRRGMSEGGQAAAGQFHSLVNSYRRSAEKRK